MRSTSINKRTKARHQRWIRNARWAAPLTLAFATGMAHAQFRASIQGTVTDPEGAVIPNATVTLKDVGTNRTLTATSNESGVYNFNALPPDRFNLTVSATGFKQKAIENLAITPEQANSVNVQMDLGESSTVVTVSGDAVPAIDTASANLTGTITTNDIQHLPSAGRDVFQLAQLAPGAFGDGQQGASGGTNSLPGTQGPGGPNSTQGIFATENGPQALSGGGQYETNSVSIDGISTTSAVWGGTTIITPNEDSVDNVKITTNGYDAEYGRFSGANLQVTTKSGTNQVHGSAFFRVNRPGLNAYQRYNGPGSVRNTGSPADRGLLRDTARFNDIGGSIGGPLLKNRLFAFFAYETIRSNSPTTANGYYETPEFDAAAPSKNIANTFTTFAGHAPLNATIVNVTCKDVGLVEGSNCHEVAGKGLDIGSPLKTARGTLDPTSVNTTNPGVGSGLDGVADIAQYNTAAPSSLTESQYNGRMDADVTQKDHLAFAIYWQPLSSHYINGPARQYNQWNHNQVNEAISLIYNHTFSASFLNEARANAAGWRWNEVTDNPQAPFGLPTDSIDNVGNAVIQPFGASGPSHLNQWTFGYKDVATKTLRNHTVKFGGDATQLHYLQDAVYAARPNYNFYNLWDFLNDAPYNEGGTFDRFTGIPFSNRYDMREWLTGAFVQDDWKATPNLTVNFGVRYNYFDSLYSKQNNLPHVVFGQGTNEFTGMTLVRGENEWAPQKGNVGPQFGFAYNPDFFNKKMVIRGGYGLNYNQDEIALTANGSNNPNDAVSPSFNISTRTAADPRIGYSVASNPTSLFGYAPNRNTITNYDPTSGLPTATGLRLTTFPYHLHTQQTHHYSLDTQVDLGHNLVATAGYQGSSAHHLVYHEDAYLYGLYHGAAFNPKATYIENFGDTAGSNYNALLLDLKHNMSHQFSVDASFTYAKSMDDASGPYEQDPYTYNSYFSRGRSDFNFGKALKIFGVYQPILFYGHNEFAKTLLNGFTLSGIYNLHTGFPWTPTSNVSNDAYYIGSGVKTFRPTSYIGGAGHDLSNAAFSQLNTPNSSFVQGGQAYFTPAVSVDTSFPNPPAYYPVPGIARNSFDGPKYQDLDATVAKNFGLPHVRGLGEQAGLEIRAQAFNLFNQTNLNIGSIHTDITQPNFGIIDSALGSRTVQMEARFSF